MNRILGLQRMQARGMMNQADAAGAESTCSWFWCSDCSSNSATCPVVKL